MKNVTNNLVPSASTELAPLSPFTSDEFTISINDLYTGQFSRYKATDYLTALDKLKKEARKRGFTIREWTSMDTMVSYVRFTRVR